MSLFPRLMVISTNISSMFHVLMVFQSSEPEVLHIAKLNKYGGDLFYDQISKYLSPGNNLESNLPELMNS